MIRSGSGQGRVSSRLWFLLVLTVLTVAACGAGKGDGSSRGATPDLLTVDVYSGRENPTVDVDADVFAELERLATSGEGTPLTVADVESAVPGLGFRGYTAEMAGGDLTVRLLPGVLIVEDDGAFAEVTGTRVAEMFETVTDAIADQVSAQVLAAIRDV